MKNPVVLFRADRDTAEELDVCRSIMTTYESRTDVPPGSTVFGRYSVLPYYKELDQDLKYSHLINSYSEHCWIADMQQWYPYFEDITPQTWFSTESALASGDAGPFVLKGQTNSQKFNWLTHMYAATPADIMTVYLNLSRDSLVGSQDIYVRKFVPLETWGHAIGGLPITNEHRIFFLDGEPICSGYYWSSHVDLVPPNAATPPTSFIKDIGTRLKARFVVADVGRTQTGDWILVELNDAQMSGLSCISPGDLYTALARIVGAQK